MSIDTAVIEEIKTISGIANLAEMSPEEVRTLLGLIGQQRLGLAHIEALVQVAPQFVSLANDALKNIGLVAEGAKESQKGALSAVVSSINGLTAVLTLLAERSESDEAREKIAFYLIEAGKLFVQITQYTKDINKDNNETWTKLAGIAGSVLMAAAGIVALVMKDRNPPGK